MTVDRFNVIQRRTTPVENDGIHDGEDFWVILSPPEMNAHLDQVLAAPLSVAEANLPTRLVCRIDSQERTILLDQLTSLPREEIGESVSTLPWPTQNNILSVLQEMFAR
jgi:mRNA interferase MazF